jgi:hypothetical protein
MSGRECRSGGRSPRRARFPESLPPRLNHLVLTGTLLEEPSEATSPRGDAVALLRLRFPVRDPEQPDDLWTLARCQVEVPAEIAEQSVPSLRVGAPVLAWGQLSDREAAEDGSQRGVIVANAVYSGTPVNPPPRLFVVGS